MTAIQTAPRTRTTILLPTLRHQAPMRGRAPESHQVIQAPPASQIRLAEATPWRLSAADGSVHFAWALFGRDAQRLGRTWAEKHGGLAALGYVVGDREQLAVSESWHALPVTAVHLDGDGT